MRSTTILRRALERPEIIYLMEAHNGLSARIATEAGFEALWASGLSLSASCGVRDNNELSWTEVVDHVRSMVEATERPVLVDADSGYGNFNTFRRAAQRMAMVGAAGCCIEDKLFPKTNSFLRSERQPLADPDEFAGRIAAARDAIADDDFCIIARTEALIAGWELDEALSRAERYHEAGAHAILIHSRASTPDEVLAFKAQWGDRCPVVIVPTRYASTPTPVFEQANFSAIIWANHLMRACIAAMQRIATRIHDERSVASIEGEIAALSEVFRLQDDDELVEAERRFGVQAPAEAQPLLRAVGSSDGSR